MLHKRGDFAAAYLSGRLVVAGGLSESDSVYSNGCLCVVCWLEHCALVVKTLLSNSEAVVFYYSVNARLNS